MRCLRDLLSLVLLSALLVSSAMASPPATDAREAVEARSEEAFDDLDTALEPARAKAVRNLKEKASTDADTSSLMDTPEGAPQAAADQSSTIQNPAGKASTQATAVNDDAIAPTQQELYQRLLEEEAAERARHSEASHHHGNWVEEPVVHVQYLDQSPTTVIVEREHPTRYRRGRYFGHRLGPWFFIDDDRARQQRDRRIHRRHHRKNKAKRARNKRIRRARQQRRASKRKVREQRRRRSD